MKRVNYLIIAMILLPSAFVEQSNAQELYHEPHRPQVHFSPKGHWMNDPNGMVFYKGIYHLFYQYYPDSTVWGPNHWGHATSNDLVHWSEGPVALSPDSLGLIASGSVVVDSRNTSGFGKNGRTPLVAIFTYVNYKAPKEELNYSQYQSIAYTLNDAKTWTKYSKNPVIKSPGIRDFRDPKVRWYDPGQKWIMTVATKDHVTFYSAKDLKNWTKESEFGKEVGAHGGVWECPDLFPLIDNGKVIWVLVGNINPGGPNVGSATQYFLGQFDGNKFIPSDTSTRWLDYGPDEYAGVTWSNTGKRTILLGWMSNWLYANVVPTTTWRSAMTVPRELQIKHVGDKVFVASKPVGELRKIEIKPMVMENVRVGKKYDLSAKMGKVSLPCRIDMHLGDIKDFSVVISNHAGEEVVIGYDKKQNHYYIDRTKSSKIEFHKAFAAKHIAPRFVGSPKADLSLVIDVSSIEMFADDGLSVMTEIFFPNQPFDKIAIQSPDNVTFKKLTFARLKSIWQ